MIRNFSNDSASGRKSPDPLHSAAEAEVPYDSTQDTLVHIRRVQGLLMEFERHLSKRSENHDLSKLEEPEKRVFDKYTPLLKALTYGSPEYLASIEKLELALKHQLKHHYAENSHHPEFFQNGVDGMSLVDLVEMLADWKAATEQHANGNLETSIQKNKERFKISDQLTGILENTRKELGW